MSELAAELEIVLPVSFFEREDPTFDSCAHWQRTMQGHAAANMTPLIASNRTGREAGESCALTFYGASFIADQTGAIAAEVPREERALITASFDLEAIRALGRHLCRVIFKMLTQERPYWIDP